MDTTTVTMHAEGFGEARPAFNIKRYTFHEQPQSAYDAAMLELGLPTGDFTPAWVSSHVNEDAHNEWADITAQSLIEAFRNDVRDLFGDVVTVMQEGRSGGWLALEGLPDVDTWDGAMLAQWRELGQYADAYVASWPEEVVKMIASNVYACELEAFEAAEERRNAILADAVTA